MPSLYEPEIVSNQLTGAMAIDVKEVVGPSTQEPTKVIRNDTAWTIDVTLKVEGKLALTNPYPDPNAQWEIKAFLESYTGADPEKQVGNTQVVNLKSARTTGKNAAGYDTAEWKGKITVPASDNPTSEYEVCRLTVVAITVDATTGKPAAGAHFATTEDLVAIYRP